MMIYMTNINKKDCEIEADIVRSTADTYTKVVNVSVEDLTMTA